MIIMKLREWLHILKKICREVYNLSLRHKLKNTSFSLLTNNCCGGYIMHDLGVQFNSPFINLWLKPCDFIKYLENIEHYTEAKLYFVSSEYDYPVAQLNDITIYFAHYKSEEEAQTKWIERQSRIDTNNLYVIMLQSNGWQYEDLVRFDNLPIKNKVIFTYKKYPEIDSSFYIKGFEEKEDVGTCGYYTKWYSILKNYDCFPLVNWFNK